MIKASGATRQLARTKASEAKVKKLQRFGRIKEWQGIDPWPILFTTCRGFMFTAPQDWFEALY
jgi:hypothetical protein